MDAFEKSKMSDHPIPNQNLTKMYALPKTFVQIILAAKWLVRLSTSPNLWHFFSLFLSSMNSPLSWTAQYTIPSYSTVLFIFSFFYDRMMVMSYYTTFFVCFKNVIWNFFLFFSINSFIWFISNFSIVVQCVHCVHGGSK